MWPDLLNTIMSKTCREAACDLWEKNPNLPCPERTECYSPVLIFPNTNDRMLIDYLGFPEYVMDNNQWMYEQQFVERNT